MDIHEYQEDFAPDVNAPYKARLELFESELLYTEEYLKGIIYPNRLMDECILTSTHQQGKRTAAFGFKDSSTLHYKTKEQLFDIFFKHFPEGVQASLTGYPQSFPVINY